MISTKGRYAVRVMIEMARHDPDTFVPLKTVALAQGISGKYLEAIIAPLVRKGLLIGQRGKGGGYKLARDPADYTVSEILEVVETATAPVACLEGEVNTCPRAGFCPTLGLWQGLKDVMDEYLGGVTLEDLARKEDVRLSGIEPEGETLDEYCKVRSRSAGPQP